MEVGKLHLMQFERKQMKSFKNKYHIYQNYQSHYSCVVFVLNTFSVKVDQCNLHNNAWELQFRVRLTIFHDNYLVHDGQIMEIQSFFETKSSPLSLKNFS